MTFEWDDAKSDACLRERGFDFGLAMLAFADPAARTVRDTRRDYGEARFILFGRIEGRLFAVAFTRRGDAIRIISARKANARERKTYG